MNIKITHNWLLEYLDTNATPYEIQEYLSLCGPSVEKIEKVNHDFVYDIEITSNRVDAASVFGIAQEAQAILPQFGRKAKLKINPLNQYKFNELTNSNSDQIYKLYPNLKISTLCSRFSAIILDVKIEESPDFIAERLKLSGIKSINNVIDISNYLMISLGQPVHIFDYDKISKSQMKMRLSGKGEKIITLDEKEIVLPGDDIVIEDGSGKLIDLCGIMGGLNSSVATGTKRIVLFVQTYNKERIRRTSMMTGQRTVAATYFEKGLDEERVEPTLVYGVKLLQKYAQGKITSGVCDIYPSPYTGKTITVSYEDINRLIGLSINKQKIAEILSNLGFTLPLCHDRSEAVTITIPSYRKNDVAIKEDIIEEIARIYGYFNLPSRLSPPAYVKQPKDTENLFYYQQKIKYLLKHLGLNEVMNYSMISESLINTLDLKLGKYLCISNTISQDLKYLRLSLLPSLIKNIKDNQGKRDILKMFEIAKIYYPVNNDLPNEVYKLGIVTNTDFYDLKGIIEKLLQDLNITNYEIKKYTNNLLTDNISAEIMINHQSIGFLGKLKPKFQAAMLIKDNVILAEIDLQMLIDNAKVIPVYKPINPFAEIKLDLNIKIDDGRTYADIKKKAFDISKLLTKVEVINLFKDKLSLRFYFSSANCNITEEEAKQELDKIINGLR